MILVVVTVREPCRIAVELSGGTLVNPDGYGFVGIQDMADRFTREDIYVTHMPEGAYLPLGRKGGCMGAFVVWGWNGKTVRHLTLRRCSVERSYHHAFA